MRIPCTSLTHSYKLTALRPTSAGPTAVSLGTSGEPYACTRTLVFRSLRAVRRRPSTRLPRSLAGAGGGGRGTHHRTPSCSGLPSHTYAPIGETGDNCVPGASEINGFYSRNIHEMPFKYLYDFLWKIMRYCILIVRQHYILSSWSLIFLGSKFLRFPNFLKRKGSIWAIFLTLLNITKVLMDRYFLNNLITYITDILV